MGSSLAVARARAGRACSRDEPPVRLEQLLAHEALWMPRPLGLTLSVKLGYEAVLQFLQGWFVPPVRLIGHVA
jgi:hypothetical protein